jgi:hypothetical protein
LTNFWKQWVELQKTSAELQFMLIEETVRFSGIWS